MTMKWMLMRKYTRQMGRRRICRNLCNLTWNSCDPLLPLDLMNSIRNLNKSLRTNCCYLIQSRGVHIELINHTLTYLNIATSHIKSSHENPRKRKEIRKVEVYMERRTLITGYYVIDALKNASKRGPQKSCVVFESLTERPNSQ